MCRIQLFTTLLLLSSNEIAGFVVDRSSTRPSGQVTPRRASPVDQDIETPLRSWKSMLIGATLATSLVLAAPVTSWADGNSREFRLPQVNLNDPNRCTLISSAMGQANAARDKLFDLRQCQLSGKDASSYDLSGVIMGQTDMSKTKLVEAYLSKGYLRDSNFNDADFTNAIVDRANFKGSSLRGAIFKNAVLTGTSFEGADLENADFTEAALGEFEIRNICKNPTLKGENPVTGVETRSSVGCK